jgi:uncharacterized protein YkwD
VNRPTITPALPTISTPDRGAANLTLERRRSRHRGRALALALVLLLLGTSSACESTEADRAEVRTEVNRSRAAEGLPPLRRNLQLDVKADAWAQHLRNTCTLQHSRLADGAPPGWRKLGENVGRGGSIAAIHAAYLASPGHRANILDPSFRLIGTAAVSGMCGHQRTVFTVQVFMR